VTKARIAGGALAAGFVLLALGAGYRALQGDAAPATPASRPVTPSAAAATAPHPSFLYGRITTRVGGGYEGRLRWGGDQEAFWNDYFNGAKVANPWAAYVPPERLPKRRKAIKIFGVEIASRENPVDLGRPRQPRDLR
jgi:hypothetical protein